MPQLVNNIDLDLTPRDLLRNLVAPSGLLPSGNSARGSAEDARIAGASLLTKTFRQVNTARFNGVGGKVDLLG